MNNELLLKSCLWKVNSIVRCIGYNADHKMLYFQLLVLFCFRTGKCLPDPALFRHCLSAVAHVWCRCLRLFLRRRGVVDGGAAPPVASHRIAALDNWPESQDPPISGSVSSSNQDQSANIRCELI